MRKVIQCLFLLPLLAPPALAIDIPPAHDAWGKFKPGSWQRAKITREIVDDDKHTTLTQVVTTRLDKVEADGVTLTTSVVGNGPLKSQTVKLGWDGMPASLPKTEKLSIDEFLVDGKTWPTQTIEVTASDARVTTVTKLWYSPDRSPYLLKKLIRTDGPKARHESTETTRLDVVRKITGKELRCYEQEIVAADANGRTETTAYGCSDVPGGIVSYTGETRDPQQGFAAKITMELEAYEVVR